MIRLLLLSALLLLTACAATPPHPAEVIRTYAEQVRDRDVEAIYESLGEDNQDGRSLDEFRVFFDENYEEIRAQSDAMLRAVERDELEIIAALPVDARNEITLYFQGQGWKLEEDSPAIASGHPRSTLKSFAHALEAEDYDTLLSLLSKEKRDILQAELQIISHGIHQASDNNIIISGDTATVLLEGGLKLELRRENGAWRIHRFSQ